MAAGVNSTNKHEMKRKMYSESPASRERIQQFKEVLLQLSARLISIQADEIDREINRALRRAAEFCGFDRIFLMEFSGDLTSTRVIHAYAAPGWPQPKATSTTDDIPWLIKKITTGNTVVLPRLPDDLPKGALADRDRCIREGIRSAVAVPFKVAGAIRGGMVINYLRNRADLPDDLVAQLRHLGEILGSALERKSATVRIDQFRKFEDLLSEVSATYINLPPAEIEQVGRNDFGRLSRLLGVDRCMLYLVGDDKRFHKWESLFSWWPEEDDDTIRAVDKLEQRDPHWFDNMQYLYEKWSKGKTVQFTRLEELPEEAARMKRLYAAYGVKSGISFPLLAGGEIIGALSITTTRSHRSWPQDVVPKLRLFGQVFANALERKKSEESLRGAFSEIKQLKERLEADYTYLREESNLEHDFRDIVGNSAALKQILVKVKQVAPTDVTVLLLGETGTGKGLIARAIHNASRRKSRPLVQVNCAALSPHLIESELFGHEKGAFTGAHSRRVGRFETANGTTLFLDEIGELPLELQAKLLRVLQDGEFERVGGTTSIRTAVRVIAATNRDLEKEVEAGRFRRDLWYRLTVFPIFVPPLRDRLEDIPLFLSFFVEKYGKWIGKKFDTISQKTINALKAYSWPGNIRELENIIERAVITSPEGHLRIELPAQERSQLKTKSLADLERQHILRVLEETAWIINGPRGAARQLGLKHSTLRSRMQKLGIRRPPRVKKS